MRVTVLGHASWGCSMVKRVNMCKALRTLGLFPPFWWVLADSPHPTLLAGVLPWQPLLFCSSEGNWTYSPSPWVPENSQFKFYSQGWSFSFSVGRFLCCCCCCCCWIKKENRRKDCRVTSFYLTHFWWGNVRTSLTKQICYKRKAEACPWVMKSRIWKISIQGEFQDCSLAGSGNHMDCGIKFRSVPPFAGVLFSYQEETLNLHSSWILRSFAMPAFITKNTPEILFECKNNNRHHLLTARGYAV